MTKPNTHLELYFAGENLPYEMVESQTSGNCVSGGVIRKGQPVWMQDEVCLSGQERTVSVYVDDLGFISLDCRRLSRLDCVVGPRGKGIDGKNRQLILETDKLKGVNRKVCPVGPL